MIDGRRATGWDDARLAAAFATRAATVPKTPPDLAPAVVARLAREPQARMQPRPLGFLAAAAAVLIVIGAGGLAVLTLSNRPPAASSGSPSASGSDPVADAARELGLTPIGVAEALATRDAAGDDREMLVSGYLSNDPNNPAHGEDVAGGCEQSTIGHVLAPYCTPMLMANPESIVSRTLTSVSIRAPMGPAFHPILDFVGTPVTREVPLVGDAIPSPITVVGHFHDRRAATCPIGSESACQSTFVVDRVVQVDGAAVAAPASIDLAGSAVAQTFRRAVPTAIVVSLRAVARGDLETYEPSMIDPADIPAAVDAEQIWVIVALDPPIGSGAPRGPRTFLIGDGRSTVVEMTADGPVTRPELLPSGPSPSAPGLEDALFGMPVITVADAIDHRDQHLDDTELVVRGFGWAPGLISCPMVVPDSPARAQCPTGFTWLAQEAPPTAQVGPSLTIPTGPAINLLIRDETAFGVTLSDRPRDVLAIGHFDDHRAALCTASIADACRRNFLVDALVDSNALGYHSIVAPSFDGEAFEPKNAPPVVAAKDQVVRVASEGRARPPIVVFTAFATPGSLVRVYEPGAETVPALTSAKAVWIVRFLDQVAGRYVARTKLIVDGTFAEMSDRVYEATAAGVQLFVATVTPPPSTDRPTAVLGLNVIDVDAASLRQPSSGKEELAVHGWYVTPDPAVSCAGLHDLIRFVRPPTCFEGRSWLLEKSEQLWSDPTKLGIDRQPSGAALNPIIPSDVAFDVPNMWSGAGPEPVEVVVLGHFSDPRVTDTYAGNQYFVVDALVWQGGRDVPLTPIVRLTTVSTESADAVMARLDPRLPPSSMNWITVMTGADLAVIDPDAAERVPELASAPAVWVIRRLVSETVDGQPFPVVSTALTADGSSRVWYRPRIECCGLDLTTTIDVQLPEGGPLVQVADYTNAVVSARAPAATDKLRWKAIGPTEGWRFEVAAGATSRELAVRWRGNGCVATWRLDVRDGPWLDVGTSDGCASSIRSPAVVLTFDRPIDLAKVRVNDNTSGG